LVAESDLDTLSSSFMGRPDFICGLICPLTYLENWLRIKGGGIGYSKGFIIQYVELILYPAGLTYYYQMVLGIFVVVLNLAIYGYIFKPIGWLPSKKENKVTMKA